MSIFNEYDKRVLTLAVLVNLFTAWISLGLYRVRRLIARILLTMSEHIIYFLFVTLIALSAHLSAFPDAAVQFFHNLSGQP